MKITSPSSQAGFTHHRSTSTADKWPFSKIQKIQDEYTILGIDMSSAFDTINRTKLIEICKTILDEDEVRLIRALLSKTSLDLYCGPFSKSVPILVGFPPGLRAQPNTFHSLPRSCTQRCKNRPRHTNAKKSCRACLC